jgi:MFS family permease
MSMLCMFAMSISLYGVFMLIPLYMERFRQFTTLTTGLTMLPGSLLAGVGVMAAGYLSDKYNPKKLFFFSSIFMFAFGMMLSSIDQYTERSTIMWLFLLWNIPMAFNFPPIQAVGYNGIPPDKIDLVSCGQNVARLLAGSVGTAIAVTLLERKADAFFESFGRTINYGNSAAMKALRSMEGYLHFEGTPHQLLDKTALKLMELNITLKSYIYAVQSDIFWLTMLMLFAIIFALFIKVKNNESGVKNVPMH